MKAQSGIEYMIIIGFVSFAVIAIFLTAYFYINMSEDQIRMNQIEVLSNKIVSSAEAVFYSGQPSQTTISVYVPSNVAQIELLDYNLIITSSTSSGISKRAFGSKVKLQGTINPGEGTKILKITAGTDSITINQET